MLVIFEKFRNNPSDPVRRVAIVAANIMDIEEGDRCVNVYVVNRTGSVKAHNVAEPFEKVLLMVDMAIRSSADALFANLMSDTQRTHLEARILAEVLKKLPAHVDQGIDSALQRLADRTEGLAGLSEEESTSPAEGSKAKRKKPEPLAV